MIGLLEKHKQLQERSAFKSFNQSEGIENKIKILETVNNFYDTNCYKQEKLHASTMNKVYVNPNYKSNKNVIHINPRVQVKPSIYINPKLIQKIAITQTEEKETRSFMQNNQSITHQNAYKKISVHVNPKLMNRLISKVPEKNGHNISSILNIHNTSFISTVPIIQTKSNSLYSNIEEKYITSFHTNVKKKSEMFITPVSETKLFTNYIIKSKTKVVNNEADFRNNLNSNLIALSQRKLVRIKKSPKLTAASTSTSKLLIMSKRKLSCSGLKKIKSSQKNLLSNITQSKNMNNIKFIKNIDNYKTNWYNKFDKTVSKSCRKKIISSKKIINNSIGLVSIGGIMYKTSRNQLIRSNFTASSMRKRCSLLNKHSQYYITKNGKKLLKIDLNKNKINSSLIKINTSISSIKNYKTNASNKVKQRSLQILRNKMRKNNQPCLLFQRFGYCVNQHEGTCPKVHDKKQVALCKNFLQGKCLMDNCQLSHNIGPEKMPTCKYFLEGCCTRDGCSYLHVKVSSKNPICVEFLRGYCSKGNECQKRHIHVCPEFDKSGKCSKGKFCQYPHKSQLTETKRFKIATCHKSNETSTKQLEIKSTESEATECRKRYYDKIAEELNQKREKFLKHLKIKNVHIVQPNTSTKDTSIDKNKIKNEDLKNFGKMLEIHNRPRPPIGPLPGYIPIN